MPDKIIKSIFGAVILIGSLFTDVLTMSQAVSAEILISEVGNNSFYTDIEGRTRLDVPVWFEITNNSSLPINISGYQVRATASDHLGQLSSSKVFELPSQILPPHGYMVLRGLRRSDEPEDQDSFLPGPKIAYIGDRSGSYPYWREDGFVEILRSGITIDFIRFGSSTEAPVAADQWDEASTPPLPYGLNQFGRALARNRSNDDTNSSTDWSLRQFATFAGPNDVTCDDDDDGDGLPDCSEQEGSTFAGLPLHAWGARPAQRDIFVEVDYMVRDTAKGPSELDDPGTIPQRAAFERVRQVFKTRGISIHFDVGDLFYAGAGTSPDNFDLDGGSAVPFKNGLVFGNRSDMQNLANVYDYKRQFMDLARKQVFHYMVFGHTQNALGEPGSSGRAELPGNESIITLGGWGLSTRNPQARNLLINFQAGTVLHEFGHNLGLRHGGADHTHYKPNYLSTMNYLYQLYGIPNHAGPKAGDRFYLQRVECNPISDPSCQPAPACSRYVTGLSSLHDSPLSDPTNFRIDYSDGSGAGINEEEIKEVSGLARSGSAAVDFDCNGDTLANQLSIELDGLSGKQTITDFDDWSSVNLFFQRLGEGDRSGLFVALEKLSKEHPQVEIRTVDRVLPVAEDRQPLSSEIAPPSALFQQILEIAQ